MQSSSPPETRLPVYQRLSACHATKCTTDAGRLVSRDCRNAHLPHYEPRCEPARIILMKLELSWLRSFHRPVSLRQWAPHIVLSPTRRRRVNYACFSSWIARRSHTRASMYPVDFITRHVNRSSIHRVTIIYCLHVINCDPSTHVTCIVYNYGIY